MNNHPPRYPGHPPHESAGIWHLTHAHLIEGQPIPPMDRPFVVHDFNVKMLRGSSRPFRLLVHQIFHEDEAEGR